MCFEPGGRGNAIACPKNAKPTKNFLCLYFTSISTPRTYSNNISLFQHIRFSFSTIINHSSSFHSSITTPTMLVSNFRLAVLALTVLAPIAAQAVQLTNDAYTGITAGSPFTMTWSGDDSVRVSSLFPRDDQLKLN